MAPLPPHLDALPAETIANIVGRLPSDDVFALRLACRSLQEKTLHSFAKRFFSAKAFHISTDSLKALLQIGGSEHLCSHVKELWLSTKWFETNKELERFGHINLKKLSIEIREARESYATDQKALLRNKAGQEVLAETMLTEALKSLRSVTTIHFLVDVQALPRHVDYRGRARYIRQCTENRSSHIENGTIPAIIQAQFLVVLLKAVHKSGINLQAFKVDRIRSWHGLDITQLSVGTFFHKCFSKNIRSNITTLHLQLDPPTNPQYFKMAAFQAFNPSEVFPNLRDLELDFSTSTIESSVWKICRIILPKLKHEKLTNLCLRHALVKADTWVHLLKNCTNLVELKIEVSTLVGDQWGTVFKEIALLPQIAHLHLMYLAEANDRMMFYDEDTQFPAQADEKRERKSKKADKYIGKPKKGCATCYHGWSRQFVMHDEAHTRNHEFAICLEGHDRIKDLLPVFVHSCRPVDEDIDDMAFLHGFDPTVPPLDVVTEMWAGGHAMIAAAMVANVPPTYSPTA